VADRECAGLEVERIEQARGQQPPAERDREAGVSLAHGHGREGVGRSGVLDGERETCGNDVDGRCGAAGAMLPDPERVELRDESGRRGGRASQSEVGPLADGLPFDVAGHSFPAGRGEEQFAWEAPRALEGGVKVPDRPAKLRACGNAVLPQCGLVVGRVLIHEASKGLPKMSPTGPGTRPKGSTT
jgi:hypothetical protein